MCGFVGVDFDKIDFYKKEWYLDYGWTEDQEAEFMNWLVEYLSKEKKARKEIMGVPSTNKQLIKKTVNYFLLSYGWKYKK